MIPQPEVRAVRRSGPDVELDLLVPEAPDFFQSHFPGFGLLPGVLQVDWAIRLGHQHFRIAGDFRQLRAMKFLHPILPGARLVLALGAPGADALAFSYRTARHTCSAGCAVFGSVRAQ